jgi:hypothetical protein
LRADSDLVGGGTHAKDPEACRDRGPGRGVGVCRQGSFYGNLFTHEDDPIDWNACRGADQAAGEFGGLGLRDCAEPDPDNPASTYCGFTYAGDCADYTPPASPYACKTVDAQGLYGDCHNAPGDGHWPASRTYREVITVYVPQ